MKRMKVNNINLTKDSGYGFASKEDAQNALVKYYKNVFGYDVLSDITSDDGLGTAQAIRDLVDTKPDTYSLQYSVRWLASASRWVRPHTSWGANYYYWSTVHSSTLPTTWEDWRHPLITVPRDGKITDYNLHFNVDVAGVVEIALMIGRPTYGDSSADIPISRIGDGVSDSVTSSHWYELTETVDLNVKKGDIIIPFLTNTHGNNTVKCYSVFTINFEAE